MTQSMVEFISKQQTALVKEWEKTWRRFASLPNVIDESRKREEGCSPYDVVYSEGTMRLLHFHRQTPAKYQEPILLTYALVNKPYILDLQPDKSVVRQYLDRGFEVYMVDWGSPSDWDRNFSINDYVNGYLRRVSRFLLRRYPKNDYHVIGYCMGGTFSTLFVATNPKRVKTLTLLAAPIDFSGDEAMLHLWTKRKYFDVDALVDTYGNCPADFLQSCFLVMKPVQNILEKKINLYENMADPKFVANFYAMENWVTDNIPIPGATFREFVKSLYQGNELVQGKYILNGQKVDLKEIKCPLLLLTAKQDHLVSSKSTEGIIPHVGSTDVKSMVIDAGHVGLVVGGNAQRTFWPEATRWLAERSTPVT